MIPFFQLDQIMVGPIAIQVWGLMVALGIIAAVILMTYLAKKYLLSPEVVVDLAIWIIISAFIFARIFYVVFYNPAYFLTRPIDVFKIWEGGASSLGGFFGAALATWLFAKKRHFSWRELLPYFDIMAVSLWLGWGIGRIGCFLTHLHPGRLSNFFLAVNFPGGARLDLGILESITGFLIFTIFILLFKRLIKIRWGRVAGYSVATYAVARFFLDFLRATDLPDSDIRYSGLTPAQWGMAFLFLALTFLSVYGKIKGNLASKKS